MEEQVHDPRIDVEVDPKTIELRNKLFKKYVEPYFNMIYKLCINYTYNLNNVEENYTEVLANFYRRIETYDKSRPLLTWLHIVTKRQIAEIEKRRRLYETRYKNELGEESSPEECLIFDDCISENVVCPENYKELYSDEILSVLSQMKEIHRNSLLLQESGYSLKEIAEIEHKRGNLKSVNVETIKSRLFLARKFLKDNLTRDGKRKKSN